MCRQERIELQSTTEQQVSEIKDMLRTMEGMVELGEEVLHMPVRLGTPTYAGSLAEVIRNPRYSTSAGLLSAGVFYREKQKVDQMKNGSVKTVVSKMKRWFETNF